MRYITHTSYEKLCDYMFFPDSDLPKESDRIIFCHADHISYFFHRLEEERYKHPIVLVSASSDYGLTYQAGNEPWRDLYKWFKMERGISELGYSDLVMRARLNKELCKVTDDFSVKCYSWTRSTFPRFPPCVKALFATNCNLDPSRHNIPIHCLPFGIAEKTAELLRDMTPAQEKEKRIYVNFTPYTNERAEIIKWVKSVGSSELYFQEAQDTEEFLSEVNASRFVLCPEGNGLDSYRILESLYLGSIPIIVTNGEQYPRWTDAYAQLPHMVVFYDNLQESLKMVLNHKTLLPTTNQEQLSLTYWEDKINEFAKNIKPS